MTLFTHKDFDPLLAIMKTLGEHLISWRDDEKARAIKSRKDYKTVADQRAHEFLLNALSSVFSGVPIISEEDKVHSDRRPEKYWIIDPIDGTASWYEGFNGFVTQAAYIEFGIPIFGIIHNPIFNQTWSAVKDYGAIMNGNLLPMLGPNKRLIITDNTHSPNGIVKHLVNKLSATGYFESGSLGMKSVLVADGTVDLFVKNVTVRDWDIAPVFVILKEVGGCLALPSGKPFVFDGDFNKTDGIIVSRDSSLLALTIKTLHEIGESK